MRNPDDDNLARDLNGRLDAISRRTFLSTSGACLLTACDRHEPAVPGAQTGNITGGANSPDAGSRLSSTSSAQTTAKFQWILPSNEADTRAKGLQEIDAKYIAIQPYSPTTPDEKADASHSAYAPVVLLVDVVALASLFHTLITSTTQ